MGYKIRDVRIKKGMSQAELCEKSGVCRATLWALETNRKYTTTTKTLQKIANALDTTIDAIFYDEDVHKIEHKEGK